MKAFFFLTTLLFSFISPGQEQDPASQFWNSLERHCGKAYEGKVTEAPEDDPFRGKKLLMHIRSCEENVIRIPFIVGDDRSRTWVLTRKEQGIQLKHDHRHEDGTEDEVTMYGGISSNPGQPEIQVFPADSETARLLPLAASNVWWITINENTFTYNLRRIGTERKFSVAFDLSKPVPAPAAPWGWEE